MNILTCLEYFLLFLLFIQFHYCYKMTSFRRCTTCLAIPEQEIYQCSNRHVVCSSCIEKLSTCQQCGVAYSSSRIRNRVLEIELDGLEFDCKYKERGCDEKLKRAEISAHAKSCSCNPDYLNLCEMIGYADCKFSVGSTSREEILSHFVDMHGSDMKFCSNIKINISGFISDDNVPSVTLPIIASPADLGEGDSPLFLIHGKINSPLGFASWICIRIWDEEPTRKYQVAFSLTNDETTLQQGFSNDNLTGDLDENPILLSWIVNAYSIKSAKYVLDTNPINIPVQFLVDSVFSGETAAFLDVKISQMKSASINSDAS
ncbi:unnamed protein product [Orchesella dallaii]|uniref:RING-type E3 ubiquitin transferase n=1 Tax=Orchesella dallaii TaxID=48710 RepID=A0ABP1QCB2_9HEXA